MCVCVCVCVCVRFVYEFITAVLEAFFRFGFVYEDIFFYCDF